MIVIIALVIFSVSSASAFESNGNLSVPAAPGVTKNQVNEAMNRLAKKIKKETDWISVKIGNAKKSAEEAKSASEAAQIAAEIANATTQKAVSNSEEAKIAAESAATNATGAKTAAETAATNAIDAKTAAEENKEATSDLSIYFLMGMTLLIIILVIGFLGSIWAIMTRINRSQKAVIQEMNDGRIAQEISETKEGISDVNGRLSEIAEEISEIKGVVKPDPFTLHFTVAGQEYSYNASVNNRGKFVSIFAPKVDPGDEPSNPSQTVRATYAEEKDLMKSCKSAMKEYEKPTCDQIQKNLIDHLLSTGELRKA